MMTNEKKENTLYVIASTFQVTGDAETAVALAAKNIKDCNELCDREIISDPVVFKTNFGYVVKCIRENGKDFQRRIYEINSIKNRIPFEGIVLNAQ